MTWEYMRMAIAGSQVAETMKAQGLLGWEAFFVSSSLVTDEWTVMIYFKRPLAAAPPAP